MLPAPPATTTLVNEQAAEEESLLHGVRLVHARDQEAEAGKDPDDGSVKRLDADRGGVKAPQETDGRSLWLRLDSKEDGS